MKNSEIIYAFLIILFQYAAMYLLLDIHLKHARRANLIFSSITFSLSILCSMFVAYQYDRATFVGYYLLLVQVPIYLVFYSISNYRGRKLFFVYISSFIFSTAILWSPFLVGSFVNYSAKIMTVAAFAVYLILFFFIKKTIAPLFHYALEHLQKGWVLLSSLPLFYTVLSYLSGGYDLTIAGWQETSYFRILILSIIYSAYLVILVLFKQTREQFLLKSEQSILTLQMNAMTEHLSELKKSQNMAAIYRHDLRHHLQYVNTCILESRYEEANNYINSICEEIEESRVVLYCENVSVNMILSSYVAAAKTAGIEFTVDVVLPAVIHVATTDLCVVLANGMENAIHACEKMSDSERKLIELSCRMKNKKIIIQITNPYDGAVDFREDLPLSNRSGHGIGTKSIANIASKYKGVYSFDAKDDRFTLSLIL